MRIPSPVERCGASRRRVATTTLHSWLTRSLVAAVLAAAIAALAASWPDVRGELAAADAGWLALASLCAVGNILAAAGAWRAALAALGSPVPARPAVAIFCVGQLGKYLPGSVWPVVVQAQLSSRRGVPPEHVVLAGALALAEAVVVSLALGLVAVPSLVGEAEVQGQAPVLLAVVVAVVAAGLVVGLSPRLVAAVIRALLRVTRRPPMTVPVTRGQLGAVLGWAALSVALLGAHGAALAAAVGLSWPVAVAAAGANALAQLAGLLAVPMPAGLGVREAALVAIMAPVTSVPAALTMAVLSRLVRTAADLAAAGLARAALGSAALGRPTTPASAPTPP